jgi:hypothetical protein
MAYNVMLCLNFTQAIQERKIVQFTLVKNEIDKEMYLILKFSRLYILNIWEAPGGNDKRRIAGRADVI